MYCQSVDKNETGPNYYVTRWLFQRSLAFIYLIGFLIALNQYQGLLGEHGIEPVVLFVRNVSFWASPSLLALNPSDWFATLIATVGCVLALFALSGWSERAGDRVSALVWLCLWALYLSFVNVGQTFYGFGWEMLLLEAGFLAILLGGRASKPPLPVVWLYRWLLFRLMFGAGLIKLRGDECWRNLSCLKFHYETQPLPGPLSWYFHHFPGWVHEGGVAFNHLVELLVPFFFFAPRPLRHTAGLLTIFFQTTLILSGNLSWLNCLSIVIALMCFDDGWWLWLSRGRLGFKALDNGSHWPYPSAQVLAALTISLLSVPPALNLISNHQMMNASFDPLHLVNSYGAFGSVTRDRFEVILEGTSDSAPGPQSVWLEYGFKAKPGAVDRRPPQVTPYHYKLDWQMWFAAMSPYYNHPWILNLVAKLLQNQPQVTALLAENPFPNQPPKFIRARLFHYKFTDGDDGGGAWWTRQLAQEYLPPLSLQTPEFRAILIQQGWL